MKTKLAPKSSGFTLVELVMVIILIGVLSALGVGLFAGRSAFSPLLATQQLSSATLLAQQAALAGNAADSLQVEQGSETFRFTVGPGTVSQRVFELDRAGASLGVAGGSLPFTIEFDDVGALVSGSSINFTFSGDSTFQTCLSSRGAIYSGSCR